MVASKLGHCEIQLDYAKEEEDDSGTGLYERGCQLRRPHALDLIGVFVSMNVPQREQRKTCAMAFSAGRRVDLDQSISTLHAAQIGAANCSNDRLSSSMARYHQGTCYDRLQKGPVSNF
jgi:hypothetical protein